MSITGWLKECLWLILMFLWQIQSCKRLNRKRSRSALWKCPLRSSFSLSERSRSRWVGFITEFLSANLFQVNVYNNMIIYFGPNRNTEFLFKFCLTITIKYSNYNNTILNHRHPDTLGAAEMCHNLSCQFVKHKYISKLIFGPDLIFSMK